MIMAQSVAEPVGVSEFAPCPNGCDAGDDLVCESADVIHRVPGRFGVVRCRGCGLVRTSPRPSEENIGAYYPPSYAPYSPDAMSAGPQRTPGALGRLKRRLSDRANGTLVPDIAPGAVLEIGCASGGFLDRMQAAGWRTYGVELSPEAAARARERGHDVHTGRVEDMPAPPEPIDLVVGWMVLEHLHAPLSALRRLHDMTVPGASCAFSVPDFSAVGRRLLGDDWILLDVPRHLHHFEPRTLADLLRAAGWQTTRLVRPATSTFALESLGYRARRRGWARTSAWLLNVAANRRHRVLRRLSGFALAAVGQSGAMVVHARRV
jgi:SAM-dependent methyltransferase